MSSAYTSRPFRRGYATAAPLMNIVQDKGFIAGSFAAFCASTITTPILPNDIDIFAINDKAANEIGKCICMDMDYFQSAATPIADSYTPRHRTGNLPIQVIRPNPAWQSFPDDILDSFDLNVCKALIVSPDTIRCDFEAGSMTGRVLRTSDPIRTLRRMAKYAARGVEFTPHEYTKVLDIWHQMSDERRGELRRNAQDATVEEVDSQDIKWDDDDDYFDGE